MVVINQAMHAEQRLRSRWTHFFFIRLFGESRRENIMTKLSSYQVQVYGSASFSLMQNGIAASTIYFFRIRVHLAVGACKYNRIIINISAVFYNQYSIKAQINGRKISLEWFYPDSTDASYKNFNWLVLIVWYDQLKWIVGYILFLNHIRNILGLSRAL